MSSERAEIERGVLAAAQAAQDALYVFEFEHPDDKRPHAAIAAARNWVAGLAAEMTCRGAYLAAMKCGDEISRASAPYHRAAANAAYAAAFAAAGAAFHDQPDYDERKFIEGAIAVAADAQEAHLEETLLSDRQMAVLEAAGYAQKSLPLFEALYSNELAPRRAIETARRWIMGAAYEGDCQQAAHAARKVLAPIGEDTAAGLAALAAILVAEAVYSQEPVDMLSRSALSASSQAQEAAKQSRTRR